MKRTSETCQREPDRVAHNLNPTTPRDAAYKDVSDTDLNKLSLLPSRYQARCQKLDQSLKIACAGTIAARFFRDLVVHQDFESGGGIVQLSRCCSGEYSRQLMYRRFQPRLVIVKP